MSPRLRRLLLAAAGIGLAIATGLHAFMPNAHLADPEVKLYFWNTVPVLKELWFFLMGFIGCMIIVYGSKFLGHLWLQKPEGYYRDGEERAEAPQDALATDALAGDEGAGHGP